MKILSIYFLIGSAFSAFIDYAHFKSKANWISIEKWEKSYLNNFDRFWLILLWPCAIVTILIRLFSNKA